MDRNDFSAINGDSVIVDANLGEGIHSHTIGTVISVSEEGFTLHTDFDGHKFYKFDDVISVIPHKIGLLDEIVKDESLVSHPSHYQSDSGLEVIDVIKAFTSHLKGFEAIATANVIKYICRWKKKDGIRDLKKAKQYIDFLLNDMEKEKQG